MDFTDSELLIYLFNNVDVFMAVFIRMLGFFTVLPILSSGNLPMMARIFLSLGIAILAFVGNIVTLPAYDPTLIGFAMLLMTEFLIGLLIGLAVMIIFTVFQFAGQLIDFQMGFGMANVMDPFTMTQIPVTGNFYFMVMSLMFVMTGALRHIIGLMLGSFDSIALGQAFIFGNESLALTYLGIIIYYFVLGFRIGLPAVGTIMVINIILGILVKSVPQMNVFVIGMPIKVAIGLVIIFLTMPFLSDVFMDIMILIRDGIEAIIGGMASADS
ncbi:MAG: flagellar biosynthetic protein FliR [Defluviitaleaceae bacterium]|nr:flagellar biosynthetic protein FliR [Defluviitaleaceae bacterium]